MKQTIEYGPATNVWIRPNPAWIEWGGGECPINEGDEVEVRLRSGLLERRTDQHLRRWTHASASPIAVVPESDIVAYRVWTTKQELAKADGVVFRDTADSIESHLRAQHAAKKLDAIGEVTRQLNPPARYYVIQPGATAYNSLEEAKEEAMDMADANGGNWCVAQVVGIAVIPEAPVWKDLR